MRTTRINNELLEQVASFIVDKHHTIVRNPTQTRGYRRTFHHGQVEAARAILDLIEATPTEREIALADRLRRRFHKVDPCLSGPHAGSARLRNDAMRINHTAKMVETILTEFGL